MKQYMESGIFTQDFKDSKVSTLFTSCRTPCITVDRILYLILSICSLPFHDTYVASNSTLVFPPLTVIYSPPQSSHVDYHCIINITQSFKDF